MNNNTPLENQMPTLLDESQIEQMAAKIDFTDPTLSITYGTEAMTGIARFADDLLVEVRAKDAGPVGQSLTELLIQVKSYDSSGMTKKRFLEKVPLIGAFFNSTKHSLAEYKTVSSQVTVITNALEVAMTDLIKDISILEDLYALNKQFHHDLSVYIAVGQKRVEKARSEELPKLQELANKEDTTLSAQKVRDISDAIMRFERRLHDLQLSRAITLQTAPQIRLIQSNSQVLVEKIQTSILSTIPIWKGQITLGLTLHGQKQAAGLQKNVSDTTNELLQKNAELLQDSAISVARETERAVVDIETIRTVQTKLLDTIEETLAIATQGREKRLVVEKELVQLENDLKQRLTNLAVTGRQEPSTK